MLRRGGAAGVHWRAKTKSCKEIEGQSRIVHTNRKHSASKQSEKRSSCTTFRPAKVDSMFPLSYIKTSVQDMLHYSFKMFHIFLFV